MYIKWLLWIFFVSLHMWDKSNYSFLTSVVQCPTLANLISGSSFCLYAAW